MRNELDRVRRRVQTDHGPVVFPVRAPLPARFRSPVLNPDRGTAEGSRFGMGIHGSEPLHQAVLAALRRFAPQVQAADTRRLFKPFIKPYIPQF